jgi:hypothetical protein
VYVVEQGVDGDVPAISVFRRCAIFLSHSISTVLDPELECRLLTTRNLAVAVSRCLLWSGLAEILATLGIGTVEA